ncbi:Carbohydrate-binding, CenC-like [uncultured Caudovirales phage]|uniref:Carbohydrate-binding, CenC-like n=1 Tax=uncultured Caudovirales phage TaxID=2100421 RepID=A0A6J5P417_9CAUD|nr:Carbohydrate-binding, CenC-like [uncultured Caudovirales phage]
MGLVAKAFQDIITFSRASSGTYVNSNGYITNSSVLNYLTYSNQPENAAWTKSNSFVQQNLMSYSEQFENTFWASSGSITTAVVANTAISPIGTLTADTATFNVTTPIVRAQPALLITNGTPYTLSVWVRASSSGGAANVRLTVNNSASWVGALSNKVALTSEWQRVTLTWTSSATTLYFIIGASDNTGAVDATCYGNVDVWGAQLVQGSVPGDYRATTSAALPCLYADYNGALRARKLCEDAANSQHYFSSTSASSAAGTYTFYVNVKAGERNWISMQGVGYSSKAWFNIGTGVVGTVQSGVTASIQPAGNGYYRCAITVPWTTAVCYLFVTTGDTVNSYTGDGSSGIYIADAQLNDGSSALAYYDTTASAYNAPRFDYDPVTLAAKGLLVEESRANLLLQSNDFQTSWSVTNVTRTLNSVLSPSGNVDGVKIAATAAAATGLLQAATIAATAATGSVYVKQGTSATVANQFTLRNNTTATNLILGTLNYSTGVFTYSTGSTGVVVTNVGNGWWRIAMTATAGITAGDLIAFYPGWSGNVATAGDFLYAYGAQLEAGAFATSYIPTVASQVTRAADVASVNTLSPWYNSVAGTLYAEFLASVDATATYRTQLRIADAGSTNYVQMRYQNPSATTAITNNQVVAAGATQADLSSASLSAPAILKTALSFAANNFSACTNGATPVTDVSGTMPTGLASLSFTGGSFNSGQTWMRRITYYPRVFTAAEQQTLTTL